VEFSLANPQSTFRIRKVKLVQKCNKKKLPAAPRFIHVSKQESTWCASIFRSKYSRNGHICILVCRMYQICANHAKSVPYFLVLKGKLRGSWPLFLCKVCCSCASFHYWPPDPHEKLLIYLLQYNSWSKSVREMTQFWHHPPLIVELLAHQSHFRQLSMRIIWVYE